VNVTATESVEAGAPIRTGPGGFAELLLNPGSFLRAGANSEVVVDSVELTNITVRVVEGSAVIEAAGVSRKQPIRVTTGNLTTELIDSGIYVFADGKASVVEGRLQTADSKIEFKKGWRVDKTVAYRAVKLPKDTPSELESWSRQRAGIMAAMNARIVTEYPPYAFSGNDAWLFSAALGGYTYMPYRSYVSPYGQRFYSFGGVIRDRGFSGGAESEGGRQASGADPAGGQGVNGSASSPVIERPPARAILREKSPPVEATVP
jgi:hypothetical protein